MGQAKRRGTFEQRKAQAVKEGRIKESGRAWIKPVEFSDADMLASMAWPLMFYGNILRRKEIKS